MFDNDETKSIRCLLFGNADRALRESFKRLRMIALRLRFVSSDEGVQHAARIWCLSTPRLVKFFCLSKNHRETH